MPMAKRVILVGPDGADGLDIFGPTEVFTTAGRWLGRPAYDVVIAAEGRSIASVATFRLGSIRFVWTWPVLGG